MGIRWEGMRLRLILLEVTTYFISTSDLRDLLPDIVQLMQTPLVGQTRT